MHFWELCFQSEVYLHFKTTIFKVLRASDSHQDCSVCVSTCMCHCKWSKNHLKPLKPASFCVGIPILIPSPIHTNAIYNQKKYQRSNNTFNIMCSLALDNIWCQCSDSTSNFCHLCICLPYSYSQHTAFPSSFGLSSCQSLNYTKTSSILS